MSQQSGKNLAELRRWADRLRVQAAAEAIRAGQKVIASSVARRCTAGPARRLLRAIKAESVGVNASFAGGFVVIADPMASAINSRQHMLESAFHSDAPKAIAAMIDKLGKAT